MVEALTKVCGGTSQRWTHWLPIVLWADRSTVRQSTGRTPASLIYGHELVLPIELDVLTRTTASWARIRTTAELLAQRARQLERRDIDLEEALARVQRMREQNKDYFDTNHNIRSVPLKEGDLVLRHATQLTKTRKNKLVFVWEGPFRIAKELSSTGSFQLAELDRSVLAGTVHGNRLKLFISKANANRQINRNEDITPIVEIPQAEFDRDEYEAFGDDFDIDHLGE